ncbi:MAG: DUF1285 domain-containing protein [Alphaproteobacteria bacterium]|nr:DUF1285 domain-containing protein [Alphaproteobacteria bacterium]
MFYIDYEGEWYHEGEVIRRHALKKLFSDRALSIDHEGRYWLSSPEARYPVQVEDVPFVVIDFDIHVTGTHSQEIILLTNMGDKIILTSEQKLFLRPEARRQQIVPYVEVRCGLLARLGRSVWMNLVNRALEQIQDNSSNILTIYSGGDVHPLGEMQDA